MGPSGRECGACRLATATCLSGIARYNHLCGTARKPISILSAESVSARRIIKPLVNKELIDCAAKPPLESPWGEFPTENNGEAFPGEVPQRSTDAIISHSALLANCCDYLCSDYFTSISYSADPSWHNLIDSISDIWVKYTM